MTTQECIEHFGTGQAVADALGLAHRSSITLWGRYPPPGRQAELEIITKGKLKSERTRERDRKTA